MDRSLLTEEADLKTVGLPKATGYGGHSLIIMGRYYFKCEHLQSFHSLDF